MPEFDALPCWEVPVGHTVTSDVGSLSADEDPVFFSTHVELPIRQQKGGSGFRESADVLANFQSELDSNPNQNTVVAVTGPSGSGKSHLVRWIKAKLSLGEGDLLVYVPREVTTLRETLKLVCDQIGGEVAGQLMEQLEAAVGSVSEAQLSGQLIDALCQVLEHEPSTAGISSAEMILPVRDHSRRGLPSIMRLERVRDYLLGEELTMRELAASILGRNKGGDQERPQFQEDDLGFLDMDGMDGLDGALDSGSRHAHKLLTARQNMRLDAVELINRSVDAAVHRTLGWRDGPSLRTVFTEVRERLKGQQLVLLFEDLALVNFVEGAILDEFANHGSDTRAPLRVVFAVTDDKYTALAETIEGRVTSDFRVGALPLGEEDAGALELREEFIARQLNLARVGRVKVLEEARAGRPLPVKCGECRSQDECFNGFGSVPIDVGGQIEEVGLFPYNRVALRRAFGSLDAERRRDSRRVTARATIDQVIIRGLDVVHDSLSNGSMPSAAVASIVDDDMFVQTRDDVLTGATGLDESMQDRIYRTRVFWMDERLETHEIAKAFGLPDMGDVDQRPAPVVPPVPPPQTPVAGSAPAFVQEVLRWVNNDDDELNAKADDDVRVLFQKLVTARIDLRPYLIAPREAETKRLLGVLLGRNSFSLGGAGRKQGGKRRFELPKTSATYRLVVGAAWLDANKGWDFGSEKASWPLPKLSENWSLPVEIESFLSKCADEIEGAVCSLIIEGSDPASVAHHLRNRAASAYVENPPLAWRPVVQEAEKVCTDESIKSVVLSFAGAVGPSAVADVAALDVARLDEQANIEGGVTPLTETFPGLAKSSEKLDRAAKSALPVLVEQTQLASRLLAENVEDSRLEQVASSVEFAGKAASQAGFFRPDDKYVAFVEACGRLKDGHVPSSGVADRLAESPFDPHVIRDATHLLAVASDVKVLIECCEATARAGQERVTAEAGGLSAESEENRLTNAGENFVAALRELAEEAER